VRETVKAIRDLPRTLGISIRGRGQRVAEITQGVLLWWVTAGRATQGSAIRGDIIRHRGSLVWGPGSLVSSVARARSKEVGRWSRRTAPLGVGGVIEAVDSEDCDDI
jgi:hypothetical protein